VVVYAMMFACENGAAGALRVRSRTGGDHCAGRLRSIPVRHQFPYDPGDFVSQSQLPRCRERGARPQPA
jgi:hypothetical protein